MQQGLEKGPGLGSFDPGEPWRRYPIRRGYHLAIVVKGSKTPWKPDELELRKNNYDREFAIMEPIFMALTKEFPTVDYLQK